VSVQEVRYDKGGAVRAGGYIFFSGKETKIISWERLFVHYRIVSAVKRAEFVSDRISYSSERSQYVIIVLNVQYRQQLRRNVMIQKTIFVKN